MQTEQTDSSTCPFCTIFEKNNNFCLDYIEIEANAAKSNKTLNFLIDLPKNHKIMQIHLKTREPYHSATIVNDKNEFLGKTYEWVASSNVQYSCYHSERDYRIYTQLTDGNNDVIRYFPLEFLCNKNNIVCHDNKDSNALLWKIWSKYDKLNVYVSFREPLSCDNFDDYKLYVGCLITLPDVKDAQ